MLRDFFAHLDVDHSGGISLKEFKHGVTEMGMQGVEEQEIERIFAINDTSEDGKMVFDEFVSLSKELMEEEAEALRSAQKIQAMSRGAPGAEGPRGYEAPRDQDTGLRARHALQEAQRPPRATQAAQG